MKYVFLGEETLLCQQNTALGDGHWRTLTNTLCLGLGLSLSSVCLSLSVSETVSPLLLRSKIIGTSPPLRKESPHVLTGDGANSKS